MRDFPRQKLGELIATYGSSLCDNPMRCRSLLLDSSSNYQLEVDVLINALEEGIVPELRQSTGSMPYVQLLARAARRLQDRRGMTDVAARWAVNSWALALGIISASPGEAVISPDLPTELASYNKVAPTEAAKPGMTPTTGGVPNIYQRLASAYGRCLSTTTLIRSYRSLCIIVAATAATKCPGIFLYL